METNSYKAGDKFLCKLKSKRIGYIPCELIGFNNYCDCDWVTLRDLESGSTFKVRSYCLNESKPLTEKWVMNKVKKLQEEKTRIESQIKNLFSIWTKI